MPESIRCRRAAGLLVLALACLAAPVARADDDSGDVAPAAVRVSLEGGRLSLEARDASLQQILDTIADRTGVRVRLDPPAETQLDSDLITISFRDLPVEEALRRLLHGRDFVLVSGSGRPAEARVYGHSGQSAAPSPAASPSSAPPGAAVDGTSVAALRQQALTDPDPSARARALEGLAANTGDQAARDAVLEILDRGDASLPVEPLVKLALANPTAEVRIKALTQLAGHTARDSRARETLEIVAAEDATPDVRDAARALLQRTTPR